MNQSIQQQIVISGVGGQGVLFVTRLLAEAAINKGLQVFTSETHGMAQRGGTVLSHLKIGSFSSPLIRPFQADGLIALKSENIVQHGSFLKPDDSWAVINSSQKISCQGSSFCIDADQAAKKLGNPKSVNLILLGFTIAKIPDLFCSFDEIEAVIENKLANKPKMLESSKQAVKAGSLWMNP